MLHKKNEYELWAARDADGNLFCYICKPDRTKKDFRSADPDDTMFSLDDDLLREVTWENSPVKVTLSYEL